MIIILTKIAYFGKYGARFVLTNSDKSAQDHRMPAARPEERIPPDRTFGATSLRKACSACAASDSHASSACAMSSRNCGSKRTEGLRRCSCPRRLAWALPWHARQGLGRVTHSCARASPKRCAPSEPGVRHRGKRRLSPVRSGHVRSLTAADGALVLTDAMPFSIALAEEYISLRPIAWPLAAVSTK